MVYPNLDPSAPRDYAQELAGMLDRPDVFTDQQLGAWLRHLPMEMRARLAAALATCGPTAAQKETR